MSRASIMRTLLLMKRFLPLRGPSGCASLTGAPEKKLTSAGAAITSDTAKSPSAAAATAMLFGVTPSLVKHQYPNHASAAVSITPDMTLTAAREGILLFLSILSIFILYHHAESFAITNTPPC